MRRALFAAAVGWAAVYAVLAWDVARQVQTHAFVPTHGTITVSRAESGLRDARWVVAYTYPAGGATRTGSLADKGGGDVRGQRPDIDELVREYPPGGPVRVFHDPDDPDDAVLFPGLANYTTTLAWVLLFVTLAAVGGAVAVVMAMVRGFDPADSRTVTAAPDRAAARLPAVGFEPTLGAAAAAWIGLTLAFVFFVTPTRAKQFPAVRDAITLGYGAAAGAVVVGLTAAAAWRGLVRPTLTIDAGRRTLTVDPRWPTRPRVVVPLADVDEVIVLTVAPGSGTEGLLTRYRVRLSRTRAGADPLVLAEYDDWRDADALAGWVWSRIAGGTG